MKLHSIRGGTINELESQQYDIGVGISLGNKWFTIDNILGLIEWSLEKTKNHVVVYVADSIHSINIEVRRRVSREKALESALATGHETLVAIKEAATLAFPESLERIHYFGWDDLVDPNYRKKTDFLYTLFQTDGGFRDAILGLIKVATSKESRAFREQDLLKMSAYLIEELPELLGRVPIGGFACDAHAYPFDGALLEFVEDIQKGSLFPEITEGILDTESKVFLEVR